MTRFVFWFLQKTSLELDYDFPHAKQISSLDFLSQNKFIMSFFYPVMIVDQ